MTSNCFCSIFGLSFWHGNGLCWSFKHLTKWYSTLAGQIVKNEVCRPARIYFFSTSAKGHRIGRIAGAKGWEVRKEGHLIKPAFQVSERLSGYWPRWNAVSPWTSWIVTQNGRINLTMYRCWWWRHLCCYKSFKFLFTVRGNLADILWSPEHYSSHFQIRFSIRSGESCLQVPVFLP